jgi:hypothetical protein
MIEVFDSYDTDILSYQNGSAVLTIDGLPLSNTQYSLTNDENVGLITVTILDSDYPFVSLGGKELKLELTFVINPDAASGIIENMAWINYDGRPGGEDEEEVELSIGPPTRVQAEPGDMKVALVWADPIDVIVSAYQIKIDDGDWVTYDLGDLVYYPIEDWWYILFDGLTNGREYTFLIRAVNDVGLAGAAFEIKSTPDPIGDIGGRNADLISIYGLTVRPVGGWPVDPGTGIGLSADKPYEVTIEMPATIVYSVIHRNFIEVGVDATFEIFADGTFMNGVVFVDRMDDNLQWLDQVSVYFMVTSGNQENHRYYDITVLPEKYAIRGYNVYEDFKIY